MKQTEASTFEVVLGTLAVLAGLCAGWVCQHGWRLPWQPEAVAAREIAESRGTPGLFESIANIKVIVQDFKPVMPAVKQALPHFTKGMEVLNSGLNPAKEAPWPLPETVVEAPKEPGGEPPPEAKPGEEESETTGGCPDGNCGSTRGRRLFRSR